MPPLDEKLKSFQILVIEDAVRKNNEILRQLKEDTEKRAPERRAEIDAAVKELYNNETAFSLRQAESDISKANVNAKKLLLKKRNEIIEAAVGDLRSKLIDFTKTSDYADYLVLNLKKALSFVESSETKVYVTPRDYMEYASSLKTAAPGALILEGEDTLIGGCKIENSKRGIFIDNTFEKKIELSIPELYWISGLRI